MAARPTLHVVHVVLHRPMRLFGVEWRLFLASIAGAFLSMNLAGQVTRWDALFFPLGFLVCYLGAWFLTRHEAAIIPILVARWRYLLDQQVWALPTQWDPLTTTRVSIQVK